MLTTILTFISTNLFKVLNTKTGIIAAVAIALLLGMYIKGCSDGKGSRDDEVADLKADITQLNEEIYSIRHAPVQRDTIVRVIPAIPQGPGKPTTLPVVEPIAPSPGSESLDVQAVKIQGLVDVKLLDGGINGDTLIAIGYTQTITAVELINAMLELDPFEIPAKTITNTVTLETPAEWYDYIPGLGWLVRMVRLIAGI